MPALREQIGDRTVSRLVEMCGDPLPLFGADHRMESEIVLPGGDEPIPYGAARSRPYAAS